MGRVLGSSSTLTIQPNSAPEAPLTPYQLHASERCDPDRYVGTDRYPGFQQAQCGDPFTNLCCQASTEAAWRVSPPGTHGCPKPPPGCAPEQPPSIPSAFLAFLRPAQAGSSVSNTAQGAPASRHFLPCLPAASPGMLGLGWGRSDSRVRSRPGRGDRGC